MTRKILLSFGDRSAAKILKDILPLLISQGVEIFGISSPEVKPFVKPLGFMEDISATGLVEVLPKIPKVLKTERKLLEFARRERPSLAFLVDAPGFNLRLLPKLRAAGVKKIVYFILPQFWAWKEGRKKTLETHCDVLISILPFEGKFFKNSPVEFHYVGHPSVEFLKRFETLSPPKGRYFVLFPGSRKNELKRHLPVLKKALPAAGRLFCAKPVVLTFECFSDEVARAFPGADILLLDDNPEAGYPYLKGALFGWIKSGTTAFETALLETPHLIFYRVSWPTYLVAKLLVKTPYLHLANIVLGERAIPELLQLSFSADNLLRETERLLTRREEIRGKLRELKKLLTPPVDADRPFAERVARIILNNLV
jgi:lipid-A-disaccharide synthase